jgi:ketopantoate reductase
MTDMPTKSVDPQPAALDAASQAFAASRSARRLLDGAGRRGAAAVIRSQPIPGARRASHKAQAALEECARKLEEARDRWAALMRGIAADLNLEPALLVEKVEKYALEIAIEETAAALANARDAATALGSVAPEALAMAQAALDQLGPWSR